MPPHESRAEQIAAQLEQALASIDATQAGGTRYWYTPSFAKRVDDFSVELLRTDRRVTYLLRPGDSFTGQSTTRTLDKQLELFVLAACLYQPASTSPLAMTPPIRWTIQNRLRQDLETRLEGGDLTLGGLAYNLEFRDWSYDVFIDDGHQWAPIIGRLVVTYRHERRQP
jgi:hypothetical protein